ncbi:MAG: deaminase [Pseudomonadota bacterium]
MGGSSIDAQWMAAAARFAARARPVSRPNPGVAAFVMRDNRLIARGLTQKGGRPHAEALALEGLSQAELSEATLYVTLEPCAHLSQRGPACADLISAAAPKRVVIGQHDPDPRTAGLGIEKIQAAGIDVDVLEDEPSAIHPSRDCASLSVT